MNISLLRQLKHLAIDLEFDDKGEEAEAVNDVVDYVKELERKVNADKEEGQISVTIIDTKVFGRFCDFLDVIKAEWNYVYNPVGKFFNIFIHTTGKYERKSIEKARQLFTDIEQYFVEEKKKHERKGE